LVRAARSTAPSRQNIIDTFRSNRTHVLKTVPPNRLFSINCNAVCILLKTSTIK